MKYLDLDGLGTFWTKVKAFLVANYAALSHTHTWAQVGTDIGSNKPSTTEMTYVKGLTSSAQTQITAVKSTADSAASGVSTNASAISTETTRAKAAESTNATAVTNEKNRAVAAEALKAPLASPALTGTPTAPTAAAGTNTTQLATTAFVGTAVANEANARNSAITSAIGNLTLLHFIMLGSDAQLPSAASADKSAIYLKPLSGETQDTDRFEEWISIMGTDDVGYKWEKLGDSNIDLSDYATTSELSSAISGEVTNRNAAITAETNARTTAVAACVKTADTVAITTAEISALVV